MKYSETEGFWDRDMGLLCKGFRMLGMDSRFVALGEPSVREDVPLILCTLEQMQDAKWWGQWDAEVVILCAWALPRYEPIARAIRSAGIKLFLFLDTDGIVSPHVWPSLSLRSKYVRERDAKRWFSGARALLKMMVSSTRWRHQETLRHLQHGDLIILPCPMAKQRYRRFLLAMRRTDLAGKLRFAPYAVTPDMNYDSGISKRPVIVAVGRWNAVQKNVPLLGQVVSHVLQAQPHYSIRVIGADGERLRKFLPASVSRFEPRIDLMGRVAHSKLPAVYQESRIILCTSYVESFHIAGAEALCCGCSVVGDARISSMPYLAQHGSGTLACNLSPNNFRDALLAEIEAWEAGERNPVQISKTWTARLHPDCVAETFWKLAQDKEAR